MSLLGYATDILQNYKKASRKDVVMRKCGIVNAK